MTFVLSDESLNADGFRVLTDGINLDAFLKNPVILGFHDAGKPPIGRWVNVRKENGKLLADAEFDMNDPDAQAIVKKIESGFLSAVSIGFTPIKGSKHPKDMLPGQKKPTVTESLLKEASIVSVPSNKNALIQLSALVGNDHIDLESITESNNESFTNMKSVHTALGLQDTASEAEVLMAVQQLQAIKAKAESVIPRLTMALSASKSLELPSDSEPMKDMFLHAEVVMLSFGANSKQVQSTKSTSLADALNKAKGASTEDEFAGASIYELSKKDPVKLAKLKREHPEKYLELYNKEFMTA